MGSVERRERHKAELRQKILDAAREIIMREGFDALTMRKIASWIEYSPAAIYLHFPDRDEIARQLSVAGYRDLLAALAPAATNPDPVERLRAIGEAYVRFGMDNPETYRLIFMEAKYLAAVFGDKSEARPADGASDSATQSFQLLIDTATEMQTTGRIQTDATPQHLAEAFWAALHGVVSLKLTCPAYPATPAEELAGIVMETMLRGLGADQAPRHREPRVATESGPRRRRR
jgi:AcrR family transcriptional regulator